jgi:hypothetical protein
MALGIYDLRFLISDLGSALRDVAPSAHAAVGCGAREYFNLVVRAFRAGAAFRSGRRSAPLCMGISRIGFMEGALVPPPHSVIARLILWFFSKISPTGKVAVFQHLKAGIRLALLILRVAGRFSGVRH